MSDTSPTTTSTTPMPVSVDSPNRMSALPTMTATSTHTRRRVSYRFGSMRVDTHNTSKTLLRPADAF